MTCRKKFAFLAVIALMAAPAFGAEFNEIRISAPGDADDYQQLF